MCVRYGRCRVDARRSGRGRTKRSSTSATCGRRSNRTPRTRARRSRGGAHACHDDRGADSRVGHGRSHRRRHYRRPMGVRAAVWAAAIPPPGMGRSLIRSQPPSASWARKVPPTARPVTQVGSGEFHNLTRGLAPEPAPVRVVERGHHQGAAAVRLHRPDLARDRAQGGCRHATGEGSRPRRERVRRVSQTCHSRRLMHVPQSQ